MDDVVRECCKAFTVLVVDVSGPAKIVEVGEIIQASKDQPGCWAKCSSAAIGTLQHGTSTRTDTTRAAW